MPFISLAVVCLKAIPLARLWCKTPSPILLMAGLLGVGAALGLVGRVDAGVINIYPSTSPSTGIGHSTNLSLVNDDSGAYSSSAFSNFGEMTNPSLEISSNDLGYRATQVVAPSDVSGFTFDLNVGPNYSNPLSTIAGPVNQVLKFKVTDTTDLTGKTIEVYDLANPSVKYNIPLDGSIFTLSPTSNNYNYVIQNQSYVDGGFNHWRMDITPEPATLALLGLGAASLIAGGRRKSKRAE